MELTISNLEKNYGTVKALKGVSLTLNEGIYGFLGPNGAGKSTLMNILTGNLNATAGTVAYDGQPISEMGAEYRRKLGYMPQQQSLYPSFTVSPFSASLDVGLIAPDGNFYYFSVNDGIIDETIQVNESGNYTFQIRNNSGTEVKVSGFVNY